jgi:hypothetical protein
MDHSPHHLRTSAKIDVNVGAPAHNSKARYISGPFLLESEPEARKGFGGSGAIASLKHVITVDRDVLGHVPRDTQKASRESLDEFVERRYIYFFTGSPNQLVGWSNPSSLPRLRKTSLL